MTRFGYTLMTEQSGPKELVRYAVSAEKAGFDFEVSSDHYFPWSVSATGKFATVARRPLSNSTIAVDNGPLASGIGESFSRSRSPPVAGGRTDIRRRGDLR